MDEFLEKNPGIAGERGELERLYGFIHGKQELGATGPQLRELRLPRAEDHLAALLAGQAVLRTGVVGTRYVASVFGLPWLLHSFRMTRVRDRDRAPTLAKSPAVRPLSVDEGEEGEEELNPLRKRARATRLGSTEQQESAQEEKKDDKVEVEEDDQKKRAKKQPKSLELEEEEQQQHPSSVAEGAARVDWERAEEVRFCPRPWLRPDGSLNRRVLDRLLGAVLGHVMVRPGQAAGDACARFAPALQPAHCLELVDLLRELGCVAALALRAPERGPVGLFDSDDGDGGAALLPRLEEPGLLDDPSEVLLEPAVDAVVRLGQFIGDKQYSVDFVCQCPCHPDTRI